MLCVSLLAVLMLGFVVLNSDQPKTSRITVANWRLPIVLAVPLSREDEITNVKANLQSQSEIGNL